MFHSIFLRRRNNEEEYRKLAEMTAAFIELRRNLRSLLPKKAFHLGNLQYAIKLILRIPPINRAFAIHKIPEISENWDYVETANDPSGRCSKPVFDFSQTAFEDPNIDPFADQDRPVGTYTDYLIFSDTASDKDDSTATNT